VHLKGTLHHEPYVKSKDLSLEKHRFPGKRLLFQKISGHFRAKKIFYPGPYLVLIPLPLNANQSSKKLRWLVKVGMFSQNERFLKSTLASRY